MGGSCRREKKHKNGRTKTEEKIGTKSHFQIGLTKK
jgi:hypothetical protein